VIDELGRAADPTPLHAELRRRGAHRVPDGRWVVAGAADVTAVLESAAAAIGFGTDPDRPVTALQARMARFTDGPRHLDRRAAVERLLAGIDPDELRRAAAALTAVRLADAGTGSIDLVSAVARHVPVAVLAGALGVDPAAAVAATAELARALAPPLGVSASDGGAAVDALRELLADAGEEDLVSAISLLFQAFDATAGLIGNAAARLAGTPADQAAALVADTLSADCPVQLTTRVAAGPIEVGGRRVPAGDRVVVVLAAAATDPAAAGPPFGFGRGPHACPGAAHATALAAGVLDALIAAGVRPDPAPPAREPRLNLRVPAHLPTVGAATRAR
jgi:cytochrome P450